MWSIIQKYQLTLTFGDIDESPKEAMVKFCNGLSAPLGTHVTNLTSSFSDGTALLNMIHAKKPHLVDLKNVDKVAPIPNFRKTSLIFSS